MTLVLLAHIILLKVIQFRQLEARNQEIFKAKKMLKFSNNNPVFLVAKNLTSTLSDNLDDLKFLIRKSTRFISEKVKESKRRYLTVIIILNSRLKDFAEKSIPLYNLIKKEIELNIGKGNHCNKEGKERKNKKRNEILNSKLVDQDYTQPRLIWLLLFINSFQHRRF